jgi:hypothetical protein
LFHWLRTFLHVVNRVRLWALLHVDCVGLRAFLHVVNRVRLWTLLHVDFVGLRALLHVVSFRVRALLHIYDWFD